MYLVIKRIKNCNHEYTMDKQIPLRIYENWHKAIEYIETYKEETIGGKWNYIHNNKNRRYFRYLNNGTREELFVRYMKCY